MTNYCEYPAAVTLSLCVEKNTTLVNIVYNWQRTTLK